MAWISGNRYLSRAEMQNNVNLQFQQLHDYGWTNEAIAGLLGNEQHESSINPAIWQNLHQAVSNGYGIVQRTPSTNETAWLSQNGYAVDSGEGETAHLQYDVEHNTQWRATSDYNFTFAQYIKMNYSVDYMTKAFCKNFERAGVEAMDYRIAYAKVWYDYINNITPPPTPPTPPPVVKSKKMGLIFYMPF